MKHVYRYKNKLTGTYGPELIFRDDGPRDYFRFLHDRTILFPQKAKEELLNITVFEHVGTFDVETGLLTFFKEDQSGAESYDGSQAFEQLAALQQQVGGKDA